MKFGEYLLKKGKIKKSELENALKFQTEHSIILGEMAVNANVLNKEQVRAIMDYQREQEGFFGDIAVKLGFLNKDEVEKRLEIHHRDGIPSNNKLENLIPLCHDCHRKYRTKDEM